MVRSLTVFLFILFVVQLWDSNTGLSKRNCEGITDDKGVESILCINLSEDNKRLIASATSGLVMVRAKDIVMFVV